MKLLSINLSPYAARVRAQIYFKDLDIEIVEPDPPLKSEGFKAKFALGKIPILILDDGQYLSESWAILNYIEDIHPAPSLRPKTALETAHMGMYEGFTDFLLKDSLFPLFVMLGSRSGAPEPIIKDVKTEIGKFDRLLGELPDFTKRAVHLGDIALAMSLYFAVELPKIFGESDILRDAKRVSAWWQWTQESPAIAKAVTEMHTALTDRVS